MVGRVEKKKTPNVVLLAIADRCDDARRRAMMPTPAAILLAAILLAAIIIQIKL